MKIQAHISIDSKLIENDVINSQSRPMSERDGSDVDFNNETDSGLNYPFLNLLKKLKDFETAIENYFEFYKSKPGGMKFMPTPKLDMYYQGLYDILKSPHLHTIIMILLYKHLNEARL